MLANLDNEVIFKKAFTDKFVLECLVRDLFGIEFVPDKVETEKSFKPKMAHINFKYDIFAQSKDERVIVEIQKIDYDYNFDRFLMYHNMAIAEMQRNSNEYKSTKTVYTIVVCTEKYIARDKENMLVQDDVLTHNSNLFTLTGEERNVFGHKLIFLNHNYMKITTPQAYRDWLVLVQQSIKNPENPAINLSNQGVRKVASIIDYEKLSAEEVTENKNKNAAASAKIAYAEHAKWEAAINIAKNAIKAGVTDDFIVQITGLRIKEVQKLRKEQENL